MRRLFPCLLISLAPFVSAEVTKVDVLSRADVGSAGYEQITGRLHFAVDPANARNRIIADIDLAPINAAGKVEFSSDVRILRPKDPARANGAAWIEIPNRGGKGGLSQAAMQQGFTMIEVGWEADLPGQNDKLRIDVPVARNKDGKPIRGVVSTTFVVDQRADRFTLGDLAIYPPVDAAGPDSKLVVRKRAAFSEGDEVSRARWRLEGNQLTIEGGFEPGKTYEVSYLVENPPVAGLGFAAIRDAVAWLKHGAGTDAPPIKHAYAFGSSQCGRFLRDFVYQGFNTDEQERAALDGVIAHIAGAGRIDLNRRWSLPRSLAIYQSTSYPFADTAERDPVTGRSEGVVDNPRVKHAPKRFYVNTGAEYWGAGRVAALTHTDPEGTRDIPLPADARMYYFAGTQHGAASFPPEPPRKDAPRANPVNSRASLLVLREAMHRWVSEGIEPPASAYPKLSDGTLVPLADVRFPAIPKIGSPKVLSAGGRMANPIIPDGYAPGTPLPYLVPQVDAGDGNELGGIRLPDLTVPLATCAGWTLRSAAIGEPTELIPLQGAWIPFPVTGAERARAGDSRISIAERYPAKGAFLEKVKGAAAELVAKGYLHTGDVNGTVKQAEAQWEWLQAQSVKTAPAAAGTLVPAQ